MFQPIRIVWPIQVRGPRSGPVWGSCEYKFTSQDESVVCHFDAGLVIRPHAAEISFNQSDSNNYNLHIQQLHHLLQSEQGSGVVVRWLLVNIGESTCKSMFRVRVKVPQPPGLGPVLGHGSFIQHYICILLVVSEIRSWHILRCFFPK